MKQQKHAKSNEQPKISAYIRTPRNLQSQIYKINVL